MNPCIDPSQEPIESSRTDQNQEPFECQSTEPSQEPFEDPSIDLESFTFDGISYPSYQEMVNAKRRRNADFLARSGLLEASSALSENDGRSRRTPASAMGLKRAKAPPPSVPPRRKSSRIAKEPFESPSISPSHDIVDFFEQHNDVCEVCNMGGTLLCCANCTLAFHMLCTLPKLMEEPPDDWKCAYCLEEKKDGKDYQKAVQACREMDLIKTKNRMNIDPLDDDDDDYDKGDDDDEDNDDEDDDDEDNEGDDDEGDEKKKERGITWSSYKSRFVSWQKPFFCLFPFLFYSHGLISFLFEQHDT